MIISSLLAKLICVNKIYGQSGSISWPDPLALDKTSSIHKSCSPALMAVTCKGMAVMRV